MPDAFGAWRGMWADLGRPEAHYYVPTGVLSVSLEQGDGADRSLRTLAALGMPYERLEGDALAKRLPFLEPDGVRFALLAQGDALMANRILADLADWLRWNGASVLEHSPATAIDVGAGRVVLADGARRRDGGLGGGNRDGRAAAGAWAGPCRAAHRDRLC